jgi:hypothetical protein
MTGRTSIGFTRVKQVSPVPISNVAGVAGASHITPPSPPELEELVLVLVDVEVLVEEDEVDPPAPCVLAATLELQ